MAGESIRFNASLNTAGFTSGAKSMQQMAARTGASVANHFAKMAGAVLAVGAAFMGVRAAAQAFNAAISMGGQLNELSGRTGETAGNLAILQRAFENAGAGADSVGPTINRLQRAIVEAGQGGKQQAEAFAKLGLNFEELKNKTPLDQLQSVGNALARVSTDSDRSALAMQLLGRSGGELIPLLRAMGVELDIARSQLGSTPEVMNRVAAVLDTVGDNFNAIGEKGKEFAAGLLERLAPALSNITNKLATIDAAGFGKAVSSYIERTLKWVNASLGLTAALDNVRTSIDGIMAGKYGNGLNLMFLTARDTAFNSINQIVAAAIAAISTVGQSFAQIFNKDSVTFAYIRGSIEWLGAYLTEKIAGGLAGVVEAFGRAIPEMMRPIADKMANSFLPGISFMGKQLQAVINDFDASPISTSLRQAQDDAAKASADYFNLFYHEADNLQSEWAAVLAGAPKAFADSYNSNMKDPLINMAERTAETAAAAERLAAAVKAAGFDARVFGDNMGRARNEMLAGGGFNPFGGPPETGETGMAINPSGRRFPWQGAGPSGPPIVVSAAQSTGFGSGAGAGKNTPQTALQALEESAKTDANARTALMRLRASQSSAMDRAGQMAERGFFASAARAEIRAERNADQAAAREMMRQRMKDMFGARNLGDAVSIFRDDARRAGMSETEALNRMGIGKKFGQSTRDAIEKFLKEQSQSETQRKKTSERSGAEHTTGAAAQGDKPATEGTLVKILTKIQERPILVA